MKHQYQLSDIDCGPTCIKMVGDALGLTDSVSLPEVTEICGSNDHVGTTDTMMASGMRALHLPFSVGKGVTPSDLAESLTEGKYVILRTLTQGIKHWIVLHAWDGKLFHVADPWLGEITYTPDEVLAIWKPRDFFYFVVGN